MKTAIMLIDFRLLFKNINPLIFINSVIVIHTSNLDLKFVKAYINPMLFSLSFKIFIPHFCILAILSLLIVFFILYIFRE